MQGDSISSEVDADAIWREKFLKVKNQRRYTSTPPVCLHGLWREEIYDFYNLPPHPSMFFPDVERYQFANPFSPYPMYKYFVSLFDGLPFNSCPLATVTPD